MFPTIDIAGYPLSLYFTLIMFGYVLAAFIMWKEAKRVGINPDDALDLSLWVMVWGVIGARVLHVLVDGFFWDYVHLCTDPMLVEGRDLLGRPLSDLQDLASRSSKELQSVARMCTESAQCKAAGWGFDSVAELEAAEAAGQLSGFFAEPKGYDVGPICNGDTGLCHPEQDCLRWAKFWAGGLTYYGGLLGAIVFSVFFATRHRMGMLWAPDMASLPRRGPLAKVPGLGYVAHFLSYLRRFPAGILKTADIASPTVALAHAMGRLGCFCAGCCFGAITDGPAGVHFPSGSQAYQTHRKEHVDALKGQFQELGEWMSLPVHPTQLYEAGVNFVLFAVLFFVIRKRKRFHGHVFAWFLTLYGAARFTLEFWRDDMRGEVFSLSTSQPIALPLMVAGVWLLISGLKRSTGIVDDGANPPLGKPRSEGVEQPRQVRWEDDGEFVSPVEGWPASLEKMEEKYDLKRVGASEAQSVDVEEADDGGGESGDAGSQEGS